MVNQNTSSDENVQQSRNGEPENTSPPVEPTDTAEKKKRRIPVESLRVGQDYAEATGISEVLTNIRICKPDKAWWIRVHPDEANYMLQTIVIELKDRGETYLVNPSLRKQLSKEPTLQVRRLYLAINRQGELFIWSVRVPKPNRPADRYLRPIQEAVQLGKNIWIRVYWDDDSKTHVVLKSDLEEEPLWPDKPFADLVELAFGDFYIDSMDHPIVKELLLKGSQGRTL
jgi:hypothetical protein